MFATESTVFKTFFSYEGTDLARTAQWSQCEYIICHGDSFIGEMSETEKWKLVHVFLTICKKAVQE